MGPIKKSHLQDRVLGKQVAFNGKVNAINASIDWIFSMKQLALQQACVVIYKNVLCRRMYLN
jgi:hypothetical protein